MSRLAFLTPESVQGDLACFHLELPSHLFSYVWGVIHELTVAENWEQFSTLEPDEIADYFADWLHNITQDECHMLAPRYSGVATTNQSIAHNTEDTWLATAASISAGYFAPVSAGVVEVLRSGIYAAQFWGRFQANTNGLLRACSIRNGSGTGGTFFGHDVHYALNSTVRLNLSVIAELDAGEHLRVRLYQDAGVPLNLQGDSALPSRFIVTFLGNVP